MKLFLLLLLLTVNAFASASRTLDAQFITNGAGVLTLPSSSDTLMGRATTDTLSNKSMSGSSNTFTNIPTSAIAGSALSGSNSGDVTLGTANGLSLSGQILSLQAASGSQPGALAAADFTTFNGKLSPSLTSAFLFVGNGSNVATGVALSGDATISNAGALTIGAKKIQASKLDSGASASGTVATADGSGGVSYLAVSSSVPGLSGTDGSPTTVTAGGGVVFSGSAYSNYYFLTAASAISVSANPQVSAGSSVGQRLVLISKSATNTISLADGTGLSLNGAWVGGLDSVLILFWNGSLWVEESRR